MKSKIFLTLFFVTATCFADDAGMGFATSGPISAEDYCAFLNQTAASDPFHFYDEKMAVGAGGSSLLRAGVPGKYHYQTGAASQAGGWRLEARG